MAFGYHQVGINRRPISSILWNIGVSRTTVVTDYSNRFCRLRWQLSIQTLFQTVRLLRLTISVHFLWPQKNALKQNQTKQMKIWTKHTSRLWRLQAHNTNKTKSSSNINRQTIALASNVKLVRGRSIASCVTTSQFNRLRIFKNSNCEQYADCWLRSASISISHILSFCIICKLKCFYFDFWGREINEIEAAKFRFRKQTIRCVRWNLALQRQCNAQTKTKFIQSYGRAPHIDTHTYIRIPTWILHTNTSMACAPHIKTAMWINTDHMSFVYVCAAWGCVGVSMLALCRCVCMYLWLKRVCNELSYRVYRTYQCAVHLFWSFIHFFVITSIGRDIFFVYTKKKNIDQKNINFILQFVVFFIFSVHLCVEQQ